jgi:putative transposase
MILNKYGEIVIKYYLEIPKHFPHVILDEYMIMPNHIHGILIINTIITNVETKNLLSQ